MRIDLQIIAEWIQPQSRVLDLGCGDGTLLSHLQNTKSILGYGLEIDPFNITACIQKGVNVIEQDLDVKGLANLRQQHFDVVVMTQALQAVRQPDIMLDEMLRLGKECIITFPNFAYWKLRFYLLSKGRMPVSKTLPYTWYNTPNIHLCTFRDFEALCRDKNIRILRRAVVNDDQESQTLAQRFPNWLGQIAIYQVTK